MSGLQKPEVTCGPVLGGSPCSQIFEQSINRRINEAKFRQNWWAEHKSGPSGQKFEDQWSGSLMALEHLKAELIERGVIPL